MLVAIATISLLSLLFGVILGWSAIYFKVSGNPMIDKVEELLPQTQCGQCSHPGCRPYATAIVEDGFAINQCPPGGQETVVAIADLLGVEVQDVAEGSDDSEKVAIIIEKECIGCTLCIQACPVDAILGSAKHMHVVIESECTGCKLCLPPCPVDCIIMKPPINIDSFYQAPYPVEVRLNA
ncbi:MAG: electron transport complex subunit RsxB [Gammaproteobacteria bacterium]|nr:MAG: electron transport complex subunit RsxB [Gammaproteobacteria bacterium]